MRAFEFLPKCSRIAVAFGMLLGAGIAQAGSFTGSFTYPDSSTSNTDYLTGKTVGIFTGDGATTVSLASSSKFGGGWSGNLSQGGAFAWRGTFTGSDLAAKLGNPGVAGSSNPVVGYCLQLNQGLGGSSFTFDTKEGVTALGSDPRGTGDGTGMGSTAAGYIAELWQKYYNIATTTQNGMTIGSTTYTNAQLSGAFQLAIWKLEYDSTTGGVAFGAGGITNVYWSGAQAGLLTAGGDSKEINLATSWLTSLVTPTAGNEADIFILESGGVQDQIFGRVVPEPASLLTWLLIGSVVGFESVRRRRRIAA